MGRPRRAVALAAAAAVTFVGAAFAASTAPSFRVADGPGMALAEPGEDAGWTRRCIGLRYEMVAQDAAWEQCLGVPVGPRRCLAYGEPIGADGRALPLVRVPCPAR